MRVSGFTAWKCLEVETHVLCQSTWQLSKRLSKIINLSHWSHEDIVEMTGKIQEVDYKIARKPSEKWPRCCAAVLLRDLHWKDPMSFLQPARMFNLHSLYGCFPWQAGLRHKHHHNIKDVGSLKRTMSLIEKRGKAPPPHPVQKLQFTSPVFVL